MTLLTLIAASFTFTATATGAAKGTALEFAFVTKGSDRDYEAMFLVDDTADSFCRQLESAGLPRGKPEDLGTCTMWPVGCTVEIQPSLEDFIETRMPDGQRLSHIIYTGGSRHRDGSCVSSTNMPLAIFSLYSLPQSPLSYAAHYDQSYVYNCNLVRKEMKKGDCVEFTISWPNTTQPKPLSYTFAPGTSAAIFDDMRKSAQKGEIEVTVDFSPELTAKEAIAIANALSVLDSTQVKINGYPKGRLYYKSFLPLVKWQDRQERMVQPFELTISETNTLVYIDADWSVDGPDPKLTPHVISYAEAKNQKSTDTCFIYTAPDVKLSRIYDAMARLQDSAVRTWYVFVR